MPQMILVKLRKDFAQDNINEELKWLGSSLGLFGERDKDSSCFRVFITLLKKAKGERSISSDEIAEKLELSRGTVVHHLHRLMEAGLVVREKRGYWLKENSLAGVIKNMKRDMEAAFEELREVAEEIDERLGL